MKYTKGNYRLISRCMYEFTGNQYYLNEVHLQTNKIIEFWQMVNSIKQFVKEGKICKYQIYNLGSKTFLPYIYNSLNF